LIPTSDADVRRLCDLRDSLGPRVFLPANTVIDLCQDKYVLTRFLEGRGIAVPDTYPVAILDDVDRLFERLAVHGLVWCRIRSGSGSLGATPVRSALHAKNWIRFWQEMQGIPADAFTLSEYLPGRDWSCQSLWRDGTLVLVKTFENISPFGAGSHPGGVSSVAELARTVFEPAVTALCTAAIRAVDPRASGVFCFDVRENGHGTPCLTEINAGRFSMSTNLYDSAGRHNMALTYVRLALGKPVEFRDLYDATDDYYMVRDLDTLPAVFQADDFFNDLEDV